jgi:rhodanese-related sulfurtransferase
MNLVCTSFAPPKIRVFDPLNPFAKTSALPYVGGNLSPTVTVSELQNHPSPALLVDVRSATEFASGHIPSAINIPLDQIEARLDDLGRNFPIILICQSGTRARIAAGLLEPCHREIAVLDGGTKAWIDAGFPAVASVKTRWSLERQVRLGSGFFVLTGAMLALTVDPRWIFLCGFVGLGLTFAGLTDICAMGIVLEKMPWNKVSHCRIAAPAETSGSHL